MHMVKTQSEVNIMEIPSAVQTLKAFNWISTNSSTAMHGKFVVIAYI